MKLMFVCTGNICRSPTAEGVFARVLRDHAPHLDVQVDSAGTHAYHVGEPPDPRAIDAARRRGVEIGHLRARRIIRRDFSEFDLILAMDHDNYAALREMAPVALRERVRLLLEYAPGAGVAEVPDPYYGEEDGFERVLDLVELAADGLLAALRRQPGARA